MLTLNTLKIPNSPIVPVWVSPSGPEKAPVGYRTRQNNVHWVPSCLRSTIKSPKGTVTQPNSRQQTNAEFSRHNVQHEITKDDAFLVTMGRSVAVPDD